MFAKLISLFASAPKTLPQANENLATAKTFAESVNAMFTAAGLQLETMLSAGADSLKLHIAGLDNTAEVQRLTGELATANENLTKLNDAGVARDKTILAHEEIFNAIGFAPGAKDKDGKAQDPKTAFAAHVEKQTTLKLANSGHPPKHVPAAAPETAPVATDAELYAEYSKMETGPARLDFYTKHEHALKRALAAK